MQFELPSVSKLATLAKCIAKEVAQRISNAPSFDNQSGCIANITVHTNSVDPVLIYLANELVEYGLAENGEYQVQLFKKTPFPYEMFPVLTIKTHGSFTVSYDVYYFDKLLQHIIYNFGAYHKISSAKYVHMYQRYIQICTSLKSDIYNYTNTDFDDYVVIKCSAFHEIAKTAGLEWIEPLLLPGIGAAYAKLNIKRFTPCLLFEKWEATKFIKTISKKFKDADIRISPEPPVKAIEKNKYLVGAMLNYLKQSTVL